MKTCKNHRFVQRSIASLTSQSYSNSSADLRVSKEIPPLKTVLVGGKFNMLHPGHIYLLKFAKKQGDRLVVVIAHDSRNDREYAQKSRHRKMVLEHVKIVDKVVTGHSRDFMNVVRKEKPSVIVLGYDQKIPGSNEDKIKKMGIKIVRCKRFGKYMTRKLSKKS